MVGFVNILAADFPTKMDRLTTFYQEVAAALTLGIILCIVTRTLIDTKEINWITRLDCLYSESLLNPNLCLLDQFCGQSIEIGKFSWKNSWRQKIRRLYCCCMKRPKTYLMRVTVGKNGTTVDSVQLLKKYNQYRQELVDVNSKQARSVVEQLAS